MRKAGGVAVLVLASAFALSWFAIAAESLGKIEAINPITKKVLLDNGSALAVDQDTKIMVEGKEGSLKDLKAGDEVRASFREEDGKNVATILDVSESIQTKGGGRGAGGIQSSPTYQEGQGGSVGSRGDSTYGTKSGQPQ